MRRSRHNHIPPFKSKFALATIRGEQTLSELAQHFDIHPKQIKQWRDHVLKGVVNVFDREGKLQNRWFSTGKLSLH